MTPAPWSALTMSRTRPCHTHARPRELRERPSCHTHALVTHTRGLAGDASAHVGRWTLFAPGGRLCTSLIGRFITSGSKNTVYAKKGKREEGSKKIIRAYWKRASKTSPTLMCNRPEERVPRSERFLCLAADGRRSARLCRRKLPLGQYSTRVSSWPSPYLDPTSREDTRAE